MRRALVTGGSGALGAAIARDLAAAGHHVSVHANSNLDAAEETVTSIQARGGSADAFALDLRDANAMDRIGEMAAAAPYQILVHCAGGHRDMPLAAMEARDWHEVIDLNLNSFFIALRPLLLPMMRGRWGRIVSLSSISGVAGNRGQANYAAAKGGMLAMAKSISREYGPRGITANVVAPGLIETSDTRELENFDALAKLSPTGRAGTPEEVAALVGFLVSEKAGYISGQLICVDGGTL